MPGSWTITKKMNHACRSCTWSGQKWQLGELVSFLLNLCSLVRSLPWTSNQVKILSLRGIGKDQISFQTLKQNLRFIFTNLSTVAIWRTRKFPEEHYMHASTKIITPLGFDASIDFTWWYIQQMAMQSQPKELDWTFQPGIQQYTAYTTTVISFHIITCLSDICHWLFDLISVVFVYNNGHQPCIFAWRNSYK